jgi:hypothetical protein
VYTTSEKEGILWEDFEETREESSFVIFARFVSQLLNCTLHSYPFWGGGWVEMEWRRGVGKH